MKYEELSSYNVEVTRKIQRRFTWSIYECMRAKLLGTALARSTMHCIKLKWQRWATHPRKAIRLCMR